MNDEHEHDRDDEQTKIPVLSVDGRPLENKRPLTIELPVTTAEQIEMISHRTGVPLHEILIAGAIEVDQSLNS